MRLRRGQIAISIGLGLAACGPGVGAFNEETGLVGRPVGKGSLAGTWAQSTEFATLVPVPILGDREGGGRSTRLLHRSWNAADEKYDESFVRCTNEVFEVEGTRTIVRDETLLKIQPCLFGSSADHRQGSYLSDPVPDIWGVRDLPDPVETPLPTKDNYQKEPQASWMFDEDEDGYAGVTVYMRGLISAELYVCKRSVYAFDGTIVAEDRVQGLIRSSKAESNSVDASLGWLKGEGQTKPNPDPLRTWFDMVRLKDQATCEDVAAAVEAGKLAVERPF